MVNSVDISSLSAGDVFRFNDVGLVGGNDYRLIADAGGSSYTMGHKNDASYPFTSSDGNLELTSSSRGSAGGDKSSSAAGNFVKTGNLQ